MNTNYAQITADKIGTKIMNEASVLLLRLQKSFFMLQLPYQNLMVSHMKIIYTLKAFFICHIKLIIKIFY